MSELTAARLRELLSYDPETGVWIRRVSTSNHRARAGDKSGITNGYAKRGYAQIRADGRQYPAHRLAWLWMTGVWPVHEIDHINGERLDNRWCNLREASDTEQARNKVRRRVNGNGCPKGVRLNGGKWEARVWAGGENLHLGRFDNHHEAAAAYDFAAYILFEDFARPNVLGEDTVVSLHEKPGVVRAMEGHVGGSIWVAARS
jgi:HNH endonuclease